MTDVVDERAVFLTVSAKALARAAVDEAFVAVVMQLTKKAIDGTMQGPKLKNGLREARNGRTLMLEILEEFSAPINKT
jgi:hypothetical protein